MSLVKMPLAVYAWLSASWFADMTAQLIDSLEKERSEMARYRRQRMYTRLRVEYGVVTGRAVDDGVGGFPIDVRYSMARIILNLVTSLEALHAPEKRIASILAPLEEGIPPESPSARRLSQAYDSVSELLDEEDTSLKETRLRLVSRSFAKYPTNASLVDGEFLVALLLSIFIFLYFRSITLYTQWFAYFITYFGSLQCVRRAEFCFVKSQLKVHESNQAARRARLNHAFEHVIAAMRASNRSSSDDHFPRSFSSHSTQLANTTSGTQLMAIMTGSSSSVTNPPSNSRRRGGTNSSAITQQPSCCDLSNFAPSFIVDCIYTVRQLYAFF